MRHSRRLLGQLALLTFAAPLAAVAAEAFDVFRLELPSGFSVERSNDHLAFMRVDNQAQTFCQIAAYSSRPASNPPEKEFAAE